jgi:hypothetical protein
MSLVRSLIYAMIAASALLHAPSVRADFYVVVQANNPQPALTKKQALDLFMGRSRSFTNGDFALIFDLAHSNPKRAAFYRSLTGMSLAQINSYWSRLMFSGQSMPPQPLPDEATMAEIVKRNPNALGWLSSEPTDKQLRVVLVLKEAP